MQINGIISLVTIISHLFFILIAFYSIQSAHLEKHLPMPVFPGKLLIVLLSIGLGFICSSFFLSLLDNLHNLIFLVH